ncbi:MAG: barstar family protein [Gordonia amarae]
MDSPLDAELMDSPISLRQFLINATHDGPPIGLLGSAHMPAPGRRFAVRTVDAAEMTTLSGLFSAFAQAWEFGDSFGHNKDAFDDCMRDLDGPALTAGVVPPTGYLTHISRAHNLLTSDLSQLEWFASSLLFYRDHYAHQAHPSATFAVVLSTSGRRRPVVRERWQAAGATLAEID